MESWHSQKLNKYTPLVKVIENNGWVVDIFAIKVNAGILFLVLINLSQKTSFY